MLKLAGAPCGLARLCLCIVALLTLRSAAGVHKSVSVNLKARWGGTSLALEALEFLGDLDQDLYRRGLAAWVSAESPSGTPSQQACWRLVLSTFQPLLQQDLFRLLHLQLATREYSARLEAVRQLARQVAPSPPAHAPLCCWASVDGQPFTAVHDVVEALAHVSGGSARDEDQGAVDSAVAEEAPIDNIFRAGAAAGGVRSRVVLYGAPGTPCFSELHDAIVDALIAPALAGVTYVHRLLLLDGCSGPSACMHSGTEEPPVLAGYGVELAVKNMEYSQVDDAAKAVQSNTSADQGDSSGEVKGADEADARKPGLREEQLDVRDALLSDQEEDSDVIPVWDLKDLDVQAAQRIAAASDPLALMLDVTGMFPSLAAALSKTPVNATFAAALAEHGDRLSAGNSFMLVNGLAVDLGDSFELSGLLHVIQRDLMLQGVLAGRGMHPVDAQRTLELRAHDKSGAASVRLDLRSEGCLWLNDLEKDSMYRQWPRSLKALLQGGGFFGQPPMVARNIITLQLIVDPLSPDGLEAANVALQAFANGIPARIGVFFVIPTLIERARLAAEGRPAPVPAFRDMSTHEQFVRYFLATHKGFGRQGAWQYWYMVAEAALPRKPSGMMGMDALDDDDSMLFVSDVTADMLEDVFMSTWETLQARLSRPKAFAQTAAETVVEMLEEGAEIVGLDARLEALAEALLSKGLAGLPTAMLAVNGKLQAMDEGADAAIMHAFQSELQEVTMSVLDGRLTDRVADVHAELLESNGALPRFSSLVLGATLAPSEGAGGPPAVPHVILDDRVLGPQFARAQHLSYLHSPGTQDDVKATSHWLVLDPHGGGARLLATSMAYLLSPEAARSRVALLLNPASAGGGETAPTALERVLLAAAALTSRRDKLPAFMQSLAGDGGLWARLLSDDARALDDAVALAEAAGLNAIALRRGLDAPMADALQAMQAIVSALGLARGEEAIVTNGRVLELQGGSAISSGDFAVMDYVAQHLQPGRAVLDAIEESRDEGRTRQPAGADEGSDEELTSEQLSDMAMVAASVAARPAVISATSVDRQILSAKNMQQSVLLQEVMDAASNSVAYVTSRAAAAVGPPSITIKACLDPLGLSAQKVTAVLLFLRDHLDARVDLLLNPQTGIADLPLKSYYAYSLPQLASDPLDPPQAPRAWFPRLPPRRVLTLNIAVPEAWLVEATRADLDVDNLQLADLGPLPTLNVQFELEALMLTGSSVDLAARTRKEIHPHGTQLYLGTTPDPHQHDTLVMSNLGYFQLKASPGLWRLSLADGRSKESYRIVDSKTMRLSAQPEEGENPRVHTSVLLYSLSGRHITLTLRKQPGAVDAAADENSSDGGYDDYGEPWTAQQPKKPASLAEQASAASATPASEPVEGDVINIFAIASGHMYERLQKIMMLSVVKNTKSKVKFWLIKNYMSPQMREFMPHMAKHYGFEVEMVTYKWPHWLHKQTNKQRIIWAYKILFLDVLFPLGVKRIIFCDSDQIVRTDMAELYHIDMEGKALAYTPFCENNKDMDGFRFWNGGFWKDHLRGKPYHISALYVVDLQTFRDSAAGDQLRIIYDGLSKDPNSLANLDQDLPNYAQHQVPIRSLPQEWLWCESWCGNDTKAAARTIDLCNNPFTKEPKLQAARRIVAEWPQLDDEAMALTNAVQQMLATGGSDLEAYMQLQPQSS